MMSERPDIKEVRLMFKHMVNKFLILAVKKEKKKDLHRVHGDNVLFIVAKGIEVELMYTLNFQLKSSEENGKNMKY